MSRNYWVISDTHFFHANSLKWPGRDHFKSIEEANELMVDNWNRLVQPGDKVYHLGDFWMGPSTSEQRASLMGRLKGSKRLILGNHDDAFEFARGGWFKKVMLWRVFTEFNCLMTHVPVHEDCIHERIISAGGYNVHGHLHDRVIEKGPYYSVCVEKTNFSPVNLEEIRDKMK